MHFIKDKFKTRLQVSVVIDDKRGWGRWKEAQNFHKSHKISRKKEEKGLHEIQL